MDEQHQLQHVTHLFDDLHHKTGILLTGFGHDPMPSSVAGKELSSNGGEHLKSACSQGTLFIKVAADHLAAFVRGISQPILTIVPWTNARAVLETSAITTWLLDLTISAKERIYRSYAFRCEGLTQQVKFSRVANLPDLTKAEQGLSDVIDQAKSEGLETRDDKNGKLEVVKFIPSFTDLVRDQLNEEASYRLLSAITHAHPWAVQQISFKKMEASTTLLL